MRTASIILITALLVPIVSRGQDAPEREESSQSIATLQAPSASLADTTKPPPEFVPVEIEPEVLVKKEPVYPALALKAGIEGKVWVKSWIDEQGMVRDVQIIRSDNDTFNQAAIDAAKQFRFKPAILNGKPVAVWVTFPFKFKIGKSDSLKASSPLSADSLLAFIQDVVHGKKIDKGRLEKFLQPDAQAAVGGSLRGLADVLSTQGRMRAALGVPGNTISCFHSTESDDKSAMAVLIETQDTKGGLHFQMICVYRDSAGRWRIRHWYCDQKVYQKPVSL
ncbi:MAG TPA: energy transducer TonB [Bacteroidota bacterium]|nr:energy transducer TonB [Bacteroidota bacterium]